MKLKYNFVINEVAENIIAVAVGDDLQKLNGFIKMNDVGAYIFKMLQNDVSEQDIIDAMVKDFSDTPEAEIRETVEGFIAQLKENDLLI